SPRAAPASTRIQLVARSSYQSRQVDLIVLLLTKHRVDGAGEWSGIRTAKTAFITRWPGRRECTEIGPHPTIDSMSASDNWCPVSTPQHGGCSPHRNAQGTS